jgi:RNA polymerase sigma factor (TIGR02999 family)
MPSPQEHVTQLLQDVADGSPQASAELLPLIYEELRRVAAWKMEQESPGQTLQATALVHEAWIRLVGSKESNWQNRSHFFGAAAEAMRRILVENARKKRQLKRGGHWKRIELEHLDLPTASPDDRILLIDEALEELAREDPLEARVVKLRYFAGLSHQEVAALLGVSERTVKRYWDFAKAWLLQRIEEKLKS